MSSKSISIQLFFIFCLSSIANYEVPDLRQSNWDTVLFLTPYGIISNYLHKESSVLWTFYADTSPGQLNLSLTQIGTMLVVYVVMLFSVVYFLKFGNKKV